MADADIIRLDVVRATRALDKFRAKPDRAAFDTLYGPALKSLSGAEIAALQSTGLAEVVKQRGSGSLRVTLTPTGRRERDKKVLAKESSNRRPAPS